MHLNYARPAFAIELIQVIGLIKLNVQQLLNSMGKTRYWLVKEMESNYETVNRLCDNHAVALQLETIEKLCKILNCMPNDLFSIE